MNYDIVIATRNRREALALSIPKMLAQSYTPNKLIVVDSSTDHASVRATVEAAVGSVRVELELIHSAAGLPLQRNIGLERVVSPVVMFPDDDSIWFSGAARELMRVYELDKFGNIGAVCAAESPVPPGEMADETGSEYRMTAVDRLKQAVGHRRTNLERSLFADPFVLHGRSRWGIRPAPVWMGDEDVVFVEWMTGFRMSFRTELIRKHGFDETLTGYALFEDVDASFAIMQGHLLVGARKAKVYHYRFPGKRGNGLAMGALQLLNRAYVICRHSEPGSLARRRLLRYGRYKLAQYVIACGGEYGRGRVIGALRALRAMPQLINSPTHELPSIYKNLREECLGFESAEAKKSAIPA